jgi:hypothetical protein
MGHTSGLAEGFLIIGIIILIGGILWPPSALRLALAAVKANRKRWAAFFFLWLSLQLAIPVSLTLWCLV